MYDNGSQQMEMEGSAVMTEQYDDNYGEEYEYGDQSYDNGGQLETQGATGADCSKLQCQYCEKWIHNGSLAQHVKNQHQLSSSVSCPHCNSQYKNEASLSNHI